MCLAKWRKPQRRSQHKVKDKTVKILRVIYLVLWYESLHAQEEYNGQTRSIEIINKQNNAKSKLGGPS